MFHQFFKANDRQKLKLFIWVSRGNFSRNLVEVVNEMAFEALEQICKVTRCSFYLVFYFWFTGLNEQKLGLLCV